MPLTPAHAAAVVPLWRLLGSRAVLSALVIGSMTPDFAYFLPLGVRRAESHSLAGLAWFVLPVGLATYLVFHLLVKTPVVALLPAAVRDRLTARRLAAPALPAAAWPTVFLSLLLGALTHLIWDSFTHAGAAGVRAFPILATRLGTVSGYEVFVFKLLQHGSTVAGLCLLGFWLARWLRSISPPAMPPAPPLRGGARAALVVVIIGALLAGAAHGAMAGRWPNVPVVGASHSLWGTIIGGIQGLCGGLVGLGVAWRLVALRARGGAPADAGERPR